MLHQFPFYLAIIFVIVFLVMLANKIKVAYPILLVLAGLAISFIPGVPPIRIDPELIFIIFLPPLLYEAAWSTSWKELWRWRRIIGSFAFLIVFLTAFAVALISNHFIPGFTLALGFLLGGIVSPPDAVSVGAILKFVKVPKRLAAILEGESLLNDASSLIVFRFALVAVGTGQFVMQEAVLSFGWMILGGAGAGVLIGYLFFQLHKTFPTDVNMDIVLTIVAPYVMYIGAEELHCSGVLSVVCGGLFLARRNHLFLSSSSRLRAINVWESLVFVLNGLVFIFIGLDLPEIVGGLEGVNLSTAIGYGVLITGVLMAGRILSAYGAVVFTFLVRNFITVAEARSPGIKGPFLLGWAGMRGVVSLAAALSIPVHLDSGVPFPQRNLILFITFVVILLTLVLQGLTLPYFIRKFHLPEYDHPLSDEESYHQIYKQLAKQSLEHLETNFSAELRAQPVLQRIAHKWRDNDVLIDDASMASECKEVYLKILDQQREWLRTWNKAHDVNEDVIRRHQRRLDIEEEKMLFL
uniref:Na+/H+ antiporter n=1 Tax=Pedobacter schmidteae TaxID=2201271 RepID=UPI000EB0756C|nr:Na+/H+ antiporter [Pedobacter schmidteae]